MMVIGGGDDDNIAVNIKTPFSPTASTLYPRIICPNVTRMRIGR
jgi:hypothetical protein